MSESREKFEEEKPEDPERTSGLMRVVGVTPEKKEKILSAVKETRFDKQANYEQEREKTPEEMQIVNGILSYLPGFVKKYGGKAVPLRPEHLHIIDASKLTEEERKICETRNGFYKHELQRAVVVVYSIKRDVLTFALTATHELIHFNSFQSDTGEDNKTGPMVLTKRREGLLVTEKNAGDKKPYFFDLNEGITAELEKRFDEEYFKLIPALSENIKEREEFRDAWDERHPEQDKEPIASITITKRELDSRGEIHKDAALIGYGYDSQRKKLWQVIKEIREKNPGEFELDEDVFNIFAKTYFTGKLLPIARLIEKTYGKGSFRKLGRETKIK
ncbi:MAG: hypothetical protein CEN87_714 [Parcubacteria group bacterium Licking1014_1]|nr:MAG: hypothetical protein CEN87_714 [Parcubacteria group bacterium Licking1014_1]